MKGKILKGKVLVKVLVDSMTTSSGLLMPSSEKETAPRGEIVMIGKKKKMTDIKCGDIIYFDKKFGIDVIIDEDDYILINYSDIIFIVE